MNNRQYTQPFALVPYADLICHTVPVCGKTWEQSNLLMPVHRLRNHFYVMRHGVSEANNKGRLASCPHRHVHATPLMEEGRHQVRDSALRAKEHGLIVAETIIYSSDLRRAKETAVEVAIVCRIDDIHYYSALRERYCGNFDGESYEHFFPLIAQMDRVNPEHTFAQVESVLQLSKRLSSFVMEIDLLHEGRQILLITHHGACMVLAGCFLKIHPGLLDGIPDIQNAEIRPLQLV